MMSCFVIVVISFWCYAQSEGVSGVSPGKSPDTLLTPSRCLMHVARSFRFVDAALVVRQSASDHYWSPLTLPETLRDACHPVPERLKREVQYPASSLAHMVISNHDGPIARVRASSNDAASRYSATSYRRSGTPLRGQWYSDYLTPDCRTFVNVTYGSARSSAKRSGARSFMHPSAAPVSASPRLA